MPPFLECGESFWVSGDQGPWEQQEGHLEIHSRIFIDPGWNAEPYFEVFSSTSEQHWWFFIMPVSGFLTRLYGSNVVVWCLKSKLFVETIM